MSLSGGASRDSGGDGGELGGSLRDGRNASGDGHSSGLSGDQVRRRHSDALFRAVGNSGGDDSV